MSTKVTYCGPLPAVIVAGQRVARGASIDLPDALAKSLSDQDVWTLAKTTKATSATTQED